MSSEDLNELYAQLQENYKSVEKEFYQILSDRFRLFTYLRIRNLQDAEEIVQNSLLAVSENIGEVKIEKSFAAWAYKILDYRMKAYFAKSKIKTKYEGDENEGLNSGLRSDENLIKRQLLHCLKLICGKNIRFARILNLHFQGYSTKEICSRLKIDSNNIYVNLSRARSLLMHCLEKGEI